MLAKIPSPRPFALGGSKAPLLPGGSEVKGAVEPAVPTSEEPPKDRQENDARYEWSRLERTDIPDDDPILDWANRSVMRPRAHHEIRRSLVIGAPAVERSEGKSMKIDGDRAQEENHRDEMAAASRWDITQ
jgi:hypothetical protein